MTKIEDLISRQNNNSI